ncbi:MAG: tetratricopeptide repeat protein [Rickettsiales bacterium]|jgi:hypothetical protein|nr:tetratricopeptide repeat protein [Rickettsiales bacterium]
MKEWRQEASTDIVNDTLLAEEEFISIIKNNLHPPDLEKASHAAEVQRFNALVQAFTNLGELYIKKIERAEYTVQEKLKCLIEASKFLNYAINISQERNIDGSSAHAMLEHINNILVMIAGGHKTSNILENTSRDKAELLSLREFSRSEISQIDSLPEEEKYSRTRALFENIAERMKGFLASIFQDSEEILGEVPCKYSVMSLGSMALKSMTPYSDLEFAILIEKYSPEIKEYFRSLTQLVHFRVINLGETTIPSSYLDNCNADHLIKKGFSFDLGGKTPLGREDKHYDLIQTIDGMMVCLRNIENKIEHIDKNLPYILEISDYVFGDLNLYQIYVEQVKNFLFEETNSNGVPNHKARAIKRLKEGVVELDYLQGGAGVTTEEGDIDKYRPELANQEDEDRAFDIKKEIYRIPDRMLYSMLIYYGKSFVSIWEAVDNLNSDTTLGKKITNGFLYALSFANWLRLKTYIHYGGQKEFMDYISIIKHIQNRDSSIEDEFFKFYEICIFLHIGVKKLANNDIDIFINDEVFLYENEAIKGWVYKRLGEYDKALHWLEIADKRLIDNIDIKRAISQILITRVATAEANLKAVEYSKRCVELSSQENAQIYRADLIMAYRACKDLEKAKIEILELLKIEQEDINKAIDFMNLALIERDLNEYVDSEKHFIKSLEILHALPENLDNMLAISNVKINQGDLYMLIHKFLEAEEALKESLRIRQKYKGENSIAAIEVCVNLANLYLEKGDSNNAKNIYLNTLNQLKTKNLYATNNIMVLNIRNNLAIVLEKEGNNEEALTIHLENLEIRKKLLGTESPEVAQSYDNIASVYFNLGKKLLSLEFLQEAIKIHTTTNNLLKLQKTLTGLAVVKSELGDYISATELFKHTIIIVKQIDGLSPLVLAEVYMKLGLHELRFDNDLKAKELFLLAENIYQQYNVHNENLYQFLNLLEMDNLQIIDNEQHQMLYNAALSIGSPLFAAKHLERLLHSFDETQYLQKAAILCSLGSLYNISAKRLKNIGQKHQAEISISKAEFYFKQAVQFEFSISVYTEYINFLVSIRNFEKAFNFIKITLIKLQEDSEQYKEEILIYSILEIMVIPNSLFEAVEEYGGSIKINAIEFFYYLFLYNYEEFAKIAELKPQAEYLQEFKSILNSQSGYYLYGRLVQEKELEDNIFLSTSDGLKFLSIVEKVLSEDNFKIFLAFCNNKYIEEQILSESDAQEFEILFNLLLEAQEDLNTDSKVLANQGEEFLETIDKIKNFVGEKELSNLPGFYQYIFNALSNNHFSKSAIQVLDIARNLISSLEKLIDISLYIQDAEIEENGDIGTSLLTQLEGLLEFTGSGQRFIGMPPSNPNFDPDPYWLPSGGDDGEEEGFRDNRDGIINPLEMCFGKNTTMDGAEM